VARRASRNRVRRSGSQPVYRDWRQVDSQDAARQNAQCAIAIQEMWNAANRASGPGRWGRRMWESERWTQDHHHCTDRGTGRGGVPEICSRGCVLCAVSCVFDT
jgi:hypothetical protein